MKADKGPPTGKKNSRKTAKKRKRRRVNTLITDPFEYSRSRRHSESVKRGIRRSKKIMKEHKRNRTLSLGKRDPEITNEILKCSRYVNI